MIILLGLSHNSFLVEQTLGDTFFCTLSNYGFKYNMPKFFLFFKETRTKYVHNNVYVKEFTEDRRSKLISNLL